MNYKVCILAAGAGTRMGELTNHVNKAILPVNFKAVISHIIEKFPAEVEFVVAVGHKKETVIDYLALAHPDRKITFVEIDKIVGPGTGPGYSLLQCRAELQSPFILFTADTIVLENIPEPKENWFGIAPVTETEPYCTVRIENNLIYQMDDKLKNDNKLAWIGLSGIHDYEDFFTSLETNKETTKGEIQLSNGHKKLISKRLVPVNFTWFDTGTLQNYESTNKNFSGGGNKFDYSKGKGDEFLYFVGDRVIKFYTDITSTNNRCLRANNHLKDLCPAIDGQKGNFYSYKKIKGETLYSVLNVKTFKDFLQWVKTNLWKKAELDETGTNDFKKSCRTFYQDKTDKRLRAFYEKTGLEDGPNLINGLAVPPLYELLAQIDWDNLTDGIPSNFHGDLQFDNILVTRDPVSNLEKFVLIDWRQDFGGLTQVGDLYYDLAKLYGGTIMSHQLIKEGMFSFDMSGQNIYFNFFLKHDLAEAREEYELFLQRNNFDLKKVKLITALIFLNMSPMHRHPFDLTLYHLGKSMLYKVLRGNSVA